MKLFLIMTMLLTSFEALAYSRRNDEEFRQSSYMRDQALQNDVIYLQRQQNHNYNRNNY